MSLAWSKRSYKNDHPSYRPWFEIKLHIIRPELTKLLVGCHVRSEIAPAWLQNFSGHSFWPTKGAIRWLKKNGLGATRFPSALRSSWLWKGMRILSRPGGGTSRIILKTPMLVSRFSTSAPQQPLTKNTNNSMGFRLGSEHQRKVIAIVISFPSSVIVSYGASSCLTVPSAFLT